jgi:succinate-semialdehyde dehydrogenase / glutarate-semialdehyde dehydrogenase
MTGINAVHSTQELWYLFVSAPAFSGDFMSSNAVQYPELKLFIAGEWLGGEGRVTMPVINPATEEVLGQLPLASQTDLDRALKAASEAYPIWRAMPPLERGRIIRKASDLMRERNEQIARVATMEEGKTIGEMRIETTASANVLEWYGEEGRRAYGRVLPQRAPGHRMMIVKEPVGPVAAFAPWNFPVGNPCRKIGAALAAGCPIILKPAEETPASALAVAKAFEDAGLPKGVLQVVFGVPAEVSSYLIASPVIRKISFTGSTVVGKQLMKLAADGAKRTTMELGGHGPVLVFDDVNVEHVLDLCVGAKYRNAGQVCVSPTRFYVHEKIYQQFAEGFAKRAQALPVGNGLDEKNKVGPLCHPRRIAAMDTLIADAKSHGAKLLCGGERIAGKGLFYKPTVLMDVPVTSRIMNEEPFGPVALINPFSTLEDAVKMANRLPYGLAAFAFTQNIRTAHLLGEQIETGMLGINTFQISVPDSPFGGVKESGHGSEEGIEGLDACLVTKFISMA